MSLTLLRESDLLSKEITSMQIFEGYRNISQVKIEREEYFVQRKEQGKDCTSEKPEKHQKGWSVLVRRRVGGE